MLECKVCPIGENVCSNSGFTTSGILNKLGETKLKNNNHEWASSFKSFNQKDYIIFKYSACFLSEDITVAN